LPRCDPNGTIHRVLVDSLQATSMSGLRKAYTVGAAVLVVGLMKRATATKQRRSRRDRVYASYARAAADRTYMAEMDEIDRAFDAAAGDGLGGNPLSIGR
jgi:hypothetical protein